MPLRNKNNKLTFIFLMALLSQLGNLSGQLDSVHWLPPMHAGSDLGEHYLYLSTPEITPFEITITLGNGQIARDAVGVLLENITISNSSPLRIFFGNADLGADVVTLVTKNELNIPVNHKGLIIKGEKTFYVNYRIKNQIQAGSLTCKGTNAKGTAFRIGHIEGLSANVAPLQRTNFVSFMATEDNTEIRLNEYDPAIRPESFAGPMNPGTEILVTLDAGESYVISLYYDLIRPRANANGIMGSLLTSDKPIVVNCGSWLGAPLSFGNQDIGIDQIVPITLVGEEYILVRGDGPVLLETPIVVATADNTEIYLNGSTTPDAIINAGQWHRVLSTNYTPNENMFIRCTKPAYVYQMLAGANDHRTGGLNFVPPLGCSDESAVDNIMDVDLIGSLGYEGKLFIVAEAGKDVFINGSQIPPNQLLSVLGSPEHVTIKASNLSGHVSVRSNGPLQVGIFGRNQAAGWAGYFSGFEKITVPEIEIITSKNCDGTIFIQDNDVVENKQWYFNDLPINEEKDTIKQAAPGRYYVVGSRVLCGDVIYDTSEVVLVPEKLEYDLSYNHVKCAEDSSGFIEVINIRGGYPPYFVEVDGRGQISSFKFDSLGRGIYPIRIVDDFGCEYLDTVIIPLIEEYPLIILQEPDTLNCRDTTLWLTSTGSSDGSLYRFEWSTTDGQIISSDDSVSIQIGKLGTYQLRIYDVESGCYSEDSVQVFEDVSKPIIELLVGDKIDCYTPELTLKATYQSSEPKINVSWYTSSGNILEVYGDSVLIDDAGRYFLTIQNQINGCVDTASIVIIKDQNTPVLQLQDPEILNCRTLIDTLVGSVFTVENKVHTWSTQNGSIRSGQHTSSPIVDRGGTYKWVVIDTVNGCSDSLILEVEQDTVRPILDAGYNGLITCMDSIFHSDILLDQCSDCNIIWSSSEGQFMPLDDENISTSDSGIFIIEVVNPKNHCRAIDSLEVLIADVPENFEFVLTPPDCERRTGKVDFLGVEGGNGPYQFSIDGGQSFSSNKSWDDLPEGLYDLMIRDRFGCILKDTVSFKSFTPIKIVLSEIKVNLDFGDEYEIEVETNIGRNQIDKIEWNPTEGLSCSDCLSVIARPLNSSIYTITVWDIHGCSDEASIEFLVKRDLSVFIPNVFTPNGDQLNDGFTAFTKNKTAKGIVMFQIFDRWGEQVFITRNISSDIPALGWNGTFKGENMMPGVYTYLIEVEFIDGTTSFFTGDVTLLR